MKKQNESSATIIFEQQNLPTQNKQQDEQLQLCTLKILQKQAPQHTRTHTSQPSQSHSNRRHNQSKNSINKQVQNSSELVVQDRTDIEQNNLSDVKQIVTNLIKVKSLPRIKNRTKMMIKSDTDRSSQLNNDNQVQDNQTQYKKQPQKQIKPTQIFQNRQKQQQGNKSQTSSNRQTKPTKTIQLQNQQADFYNQYTHQNQNIHESQQPNNYQIKINYTTANTQYKSYQNMKKQKSHNIIPCNARRQLGNSDDDNEVRQKQEHEVNSEQDDEQQYSQARYLQQLKIYNQRKKTQTHKPVTKPPSLQIKFGHSMQQKFVTTPIKPGFKFQSIITIDSGIFGMGNKYHLHQKYQSNILISAKKQIISLSSCFILSLDKNNHSRRHEGFMGIMESNFSGTLWNLSSPVLSSKFNEGQVAKDLIPSMSATYGSSILGSKSTRDMIVYFIDPSLSRKQRQRINLQDQIKSNRKKYLIQLESAKPSFIKGNCKDAIKQKFHTLKQELKEQYVSNFRKAKLKHVPDEHPIPIIDYARIRFKFSQSRQQTIGKLSPVPDSSSQRLAHMFQSL